MCYPDDSAKSRPCFGEDVPLSADVKGEITDTATAPNVDTSGTTRRAVRVMRLDVAHYLYKDPLLRSNQIDDPEFPPCNISSPHVLFFS